MGSISGRIIFLAPYKNPGQLHYLALSQKGILNPLLFSNSSLFLSQRLNYLLLIGTMVLVRSVM